MDIVKHLTKLKNASPHQKSLLVDDFSDLFQSGRILASTATAIITAVIQLLETESDREVVESIFNIFELATIEHDFCKHLIVDTTVKYLPRLEVCTLYHALVIIGESNLPNKKELLTIYLESENIFIRELAQKQLLFCRAISAI